LGGWRFTRAQDRSSQGGPFAAPQMAFYAMIEALFWAKGIEAFLDVQKERTCMYVQSHNQVDLEDFF
jgi:hypothetical protein